MELYDLKQHINQPTQVKGHTLDVVITPNKEKYLQDTSVTEIDLSDHFLIDFSMNAVWNKQKTKVIKYRPTKSIDMEEFSKEVKEKLDSLPQTRDLATKVGNYNSALSEVVDGFSPIRTKTVKIVPHAPWFDHEYVAIRKERRKAEKKFRRTGLDGDKKVYTTLRKKAINTSFKKKKGYITERLERDSGKLLCSKRTDSVIKELTLK